MQQTSVDGIPSCVMPQWQSAYANASLQNDDVEALVLDVASLRGHAPCERRWIEKPFSAGFWSAAVL